MLAAAVHGACSSHQQRDGERLAWRYTAHDGVRRAHAQQVTVPQAAQGAASARLRRQSVGHEVSAAARICAHAHAHAQGTLAAAKHIGAPPRRKS
jgi:hypothetical protein